MSLDAAIRDAATAAVQAAINKELVVVVTHEPDQYTSYTLEQAAKRMNLSVYDINQLRNQGVLRWRRIGGNKVRILEHDIQAYYRWQSSFTPDVDLPAIPEAFSRLDRDAAIKKTHR